MPKKKHGGGAASQPTTNADDSFIVFSNAKDKPETRDASVSRKEQSAPNGAAQAAAGEAPKRPDTKTLIGGASWTGKLPVNMLAEHCQKQRWEKPEYTMVGRVLLELLAQISDVMTLHRVNLQMGTPQWLFSRRSIRRLKSSAFSPPSSYRQPINILLFNLLRWKLATLLQLTHCFASVACGIYI